MKSNNILLRANRLNEVVTRIDFKEVGKSKPCDCLTRTKDNLLKHIPLSPCTLCYRSPT